jgi:DNA repair protein RadC
MRLAMKPTTTTSPDSLLLAGDAALVSNLDLLAILVGAAAAGSLLESFPTLTQLDDASPRELAAVPGLDDASVVRLLAQRELARRRAVERALKGAPVLSAQAAVAILEPLLRGETREIVMVLALDTKKRLVCAPLTIAIGTNDSAPCHPREVFRPLIRVSASSAIIAHLHPSSGEPVPSPEDIMLTERLREAGALVGIPMVDHIVIGRGSYISMAERGLL